MKYKFNVGDRVACYTCAGRRVGRIWCVLPGDCLSVKIEGSTFTALHSKQLRKLVPAKSRRRFWVNVYLGGPIGAHFSEIDARSARSTVTNLTSETIEVVEVRRKVKK